MGIVVSSGVRASEDSMMFHVTTDQAKDYLQTKFNLIREAAKKKGINMPEINIIMYTQEMGKKFLPFILILPQEVLEKGNMNDDNISSIFKPEDDSVGVRFQKPFYDMLRAYTFNKDDKNAFRSTDWKRRAGIRGSITGAMIKYATPKIEHFSGAGRKVVMLIDPIRLIHDMLVNDSIPNQKFEVWLENWKKIENGNYDFTVERKVVKSKGENKDNLYAQMLRRVNGGN